MAIGYLVGVAATTYHLSNGIVGFVSSFGLVRSERTLKKLERYCQLGGALLFVVGVCTVLYFATGSPAFTGAR
jgi:succinate dehydrogenase/fumarate reductase cytochrome b subunit